jgi:hypothetical protein
MHLLLSIVAIGFAFLVMLGAQSFVRDLVALSKHRPPSVFDALREDDHESDNRHRRVTSPSPKARGPIKFPISSQVDRAEV